jgi:hypothetical protein
MNESNLTSKKRLPPVSSGSTKRPEIRAISDDDLNVVVGGATNREVYKAFFDAFEKAAHPITLEIGPAVVL